MSAADQGLISASTVRESVPALILEAVHCTSSSCCHSGSTLYSLCDWLANTGRCITCRCQVYLNCRCQVYLNSCICEVQNVKKYQIDTHHMCFSSSKCAKSRFWSRLHPGLRWGSLRCSPYALVGWEGYPLHISLPLTPSVSQSRCLGCSSILGAVSVLPAPWLTVLPLLFLQIKHCCWWWFADCLHQSVRVLWDTYLRGHSYPWGHILFPMLSQNICLAHLLLYCRCRRFTDVLQNQWQFFSSLIYLQYSS